MRHWRSALVGMLLVAAGLPVPVAVAAETSAGVVEFSGRDIDAVVTERGEVLRSVLVDQSAHDVAALLAGEVVGVEVGAAFSDKPVAAVSVSLPLPDGARIELAGSSAELSTVPLFDEYGRVADWGQSLSWRSESAANEGNSTATITVARVGADDRWVVAGGTVETSLGDFQLLQTDAGVVVRDTPKDLPDDVDRTLPPLKGQEPKVEEPSSDVVQPDGLLGSRSGWVAMPASTPANPTYVDVLGATARGLNLNEGFFYLVGGLNDMDATLDNSSSSGYETGNGDMRLVGMIGTTYVQAGVADQDVLNMEAGAGGPATLQIVHSARNLVGADLVMLVVPDPVESGSTCGQARSPGEFAVATIETDPDCTNRKAVPHELGHSLAGSHQNESDPPYPNALAYPSTSTPSTCSVIHTRTACRKLVYSTPFRDFPGTSSDAGSSTRFNAAAISDHLTSASANKTVPVQGGGKFTAVTPTRILDTRSTGASAGVGGYLTPFGAGTSRQVSVAGNGGVPGGATAAVINITVVGGTSGGYLTGWAFPDAQPATSSTNWAAGQTRASTMVVPIGDYGLINIYTSQSTNVIIDVFGYFGGNNATTAKYSPVTPKRVYDTRPSSGFAANETRNISVTAAGVPAGATAAVVNLTAVGATSNGWLTLSGSSTSIINYSSSGQSIANLAFAPVVGGNITVTASSATHVIVDVVGFVGSTGTLNYYPITPARLIGPMPMGAGGYVDLTITGVAGIPSTAGAVMANVTGSGATLSTWINAYPKGATIPAPIPSTVNVQPGAANANHSIVQPGTSNQARVTNANGLVNMYFDVEGYFAT